MWGWRSSRTIAVAATVAGFALFCLLPLAYMIAVTLSDPSRETSAFRALALDSRQRGLLFNTAVPGAATALAASLVGIPLGVTLARVRPPFRSGLRIVLGAPALLPSYIVGLAWLSLVLPRHLVGASNDDPVAIAQAARDLDGVPDGAACPDFSQFESFRRSLNVHTRMVAITHDRCRWHGHDTCRT